MRSHLRIILGVAALALASIITLYPQKKSIAITMDDLPVVSTRTDLKTRQEITRKILAHIRHAHAPVIGFVNEGKLYTDGKRDEQQIDLLRMWLDAGLELGNHTYSHFNLNKGLTEFEADLLKGEPITRELMEAHGKRLLYFRHPYLFAGRTQEIKDQLGAFLTEHGYRIAPVTFDDSDYIFARAYDNALDKHDRAMMKQVGADYVPYMEQKLVYWERQSDRLFARQIPITLLIHANIINSIYLGDLIKMFKRHGYDLVNLDTALKDPAYSLPDHYYGPAGISWLHRWALERGREFIVPGEPKVPDYVLKLSGFDSE
ncbi:MAG TPA: polysaccharide deacetylase family protein [Pyrinomonadaceae bacterium]